MNAGAISYSISAFTFLIFLAVLLTDKHKGATKRSLLLAVAASCIWSFTLAYESSGFIDDVQIPLFEYLKTITWLALLIELLRVIYSERIPGKTSKRIQIVIYVFLSVSMLPVFLEYIFGKSGLIDGFEYQSALNLGFSILGIVFIEQIYRNTRTEQKWAIRYLCLGLLGMFVYDFYLYSDALLYKEIDPVLWQARGFVYALTVPLLGVTISRDPLWTPEIFISRRVAFYTATLVSSGIYLVTMAIAGFYGR